MRPRFLLSPSLLTLVLFFACLPKLFADVYASEHQGKWVLGNENLERVLEFRDGKLGTTAFQNKVSGRTYSLDGDEFELRLDGEPLAYEAGSQNPWVLTNADFAFQECHITSLTNGGKQVVCSLSNHDRKPALEVKVFYDLQPKSASTRQWLELRTTGSGTFFIEYAAVQQNGWGLASFSLGGFGQPVYAQDLFFGLEYPSSINRFSGEKLSLGSYVGLNIPPDGFQSEPAVVGVALPGAVKPAFFQYVDSIRARRVKPFVLYNTWYDLQRESMNHENTVQRVEQMKQQLVEKQHVRMDSFVLDDGWDNMKQLWQVSADRFPKGFVDLAAKLQSAESELGIWFGPVGGYDHRKDRIDTGAAAGMEVTSNGQYLCLAGRHYSEYFTKAVTDLQKQYNLNYLKLDGVPFGCNAQDHGHPTGVFVREADERVFINLLKQLRSQRKDIFLNVTTGIWMSPWWLQYADAVWMGGEDSGYLTTLPTLSPRQSALSYRDAILYDDLVHQQLQFPASSLMTHGIIKGKFNMLGGEQEPIDDWRDEVIHYVSVGNMMTELYITPSLLSPKEWQILGGTLRWARENEHPLLDNTTMILRDPAQREPYGFLHWSEKKTIITLRNPFVAPRTASFKLTAETGFRSLKGQFQVQTIYPFRATEAGAVSYGGTLNVDLDGFEERVIELTPSGGPSDTRIDLQAKMKDALRLSEAIVNPVPGSTSTSLAVRLNVPAEYTTCTFAVLFEPESETPGVSMTGRDDGKGLKLRTENGGHALWQWFSASLNPGSHEIQVQLNFQAQPPSGSHLSAWLITKKAPLKERLFPNGEVEDENLPVPSSVERKTYQIWSGTVVQ